MDMGRLMISIGIAVGVVLSGTIFWADSYGKLFFRFIRTIVLATLIIGIPLWYPYAAAYVYPMLPGN